MDEPTFTSLLYGALSHLLTIGGFLLAVFLIARLMREKRQPGNTFAWLLVIVLIPYLGVPLYLLFGGRKLRRLVSEKDRLFPSLPEDAIPAACADYPIARAITTGGGSPPVGGNAISLLKTGEEAYHALAKGILEAKHCIHITTFIIGNDEVGRRIVQLLAERAKDGIQVRLLIDAVGCMFIFNSFFKAIKEAGGEVQWFMPVLPFTSRSSANLRNHRKIAVFDQHTAIVGGHNIAKEYMGPETYDERWSDFGAQIEGPAAAMINDIFVADWCYASHQQPEDIQPPRVAGIEGEAELQVIASGPDVRGDPFYDGLLTMVQSADVSIVIVTPYYIPDEVLQRSLIVKARAGRDVTLILPAKSNHPITDFARKHHVRELRAAGVKVQLFAPGMLHSKATIIDDRIAIFGSANCDLRSLFVNFEIGVVVHTKPDVHAISEWAQSLLPSCSSAEPPQNHRFPRINALTEDLSRMLAPLL